MVSAGFGTRSGPTRNVFAAGQWVGYLQSMEPTQVLREVNEEARRNSLADIVFTGPPSSGIHRLQHTFERSFDVSPFVLRHLWIDLRSIGDE